MAEQDDNPFGAEGNPFRVPTNPFRDPPPGPSTAETVADMGESAVRGFNKGLVGLATLPYRGVDWVGEKITGGDFLPNVEEMPWYKPFLQQPEPKTTAGKFAGASGEVLGSSVIPSGTLLGKAEQLSKLTPTTTARALGQSIGEQIASNPGRAVAADAIASVGAGVGQESAKEMGFGPGGQMIGGMAGAMAPMGIAATANKARDIVRSARASADPYERITKGLGDNSIDDLANSVAVGSTSANSGNSRFALDVLGEEMVRTGGDRPAALRSTLQRIQDRILPDAADRLRQSMATRLRNGESPFPPGTPPEEIDNFIRVVVNGEQAPVGSLPFPSIAAEVEKEASRRASETAKDWLRRVVRDAHGESDLLFGEYPSVMQSNMQTRLSRPENVVDETAGAIQESGTQRLLDYIANTGSMASSQNVRNAVAARAQNLRESTEGLINNLSPNGRTIRDVADMSNNAAEAASRDYAIVHAPGSNLVDNGALSSGLQDVVEKYYNVAAGRSGERAEAIRKALSEFFIDLPNGQKIVMPTLQMAQDMRGALRGIIKKARAAQDDNVVNALQPIYDDVTSVMRRSSPAWADVNRRWADMELDRVAAELGEAFVNKAGPKFREQMDQFNALAPEAQDIVRVHFAQQLLDMIENGVKLGGGRNLGELFTKGHTRNMIRDILGDDAAVQMARKIRDLNVASRSKEMMRGSPTHIRKQVQEEQDADIHLVESAQHLDLKNWREALLQRAIAMWREKRNKVMGKALTTPMSDVPAVAENLERMKAARSAAERYALPRGGRPAYQQGLPTQIGNVESAYSPDSWLDDNGQLNVRISPRRP